jgi:hypothetical protein
MSPTYVTKMKKFSDYYWLYRKYNRELQKMAKPGKIQKKLNQPLEARKRSTRIKVFSRQGKRKQCQIVEN